MRDGAIDETRTRRNEQQSKMERGGKGREGREEVKEEEVPNMLRFAA